MKFVFLTQYDRNMTPFEILIVRSEIIDFFLLHTDFII